MGESRESVQQAFAKFVGWRSHIIKALINEDKPFRTNIFGEQERCVLQVELDDELEIKKRASIRQVISALEIMEPLVHCCRTVDSECYVCGKSASSAYWNWCGTCKDDEVRQYCNFCESNYDQCQSCFSDFAEVVRCSDKFRYPRSAEW